MWKKIARSVILTIRQVKCYKIIANSTEEYFKSVNRLIKIQIRSSAPDACIISNNVNNVLSTILAGNIGYYDNWNTLQELYVDVREDDYVDGNTVDCWYTEFSVWMNTTTQPSVTSKLNSGW